MHETDGGGGDRADRPAQTGVPLCRSVGGRHLQLSTRLRGGHSSHPLSVGESTVVAVAVEMSGVVVARARVKTRSRRSTTRPTGVPVVLVAGGVQGKRTKRRSRGRPQMTAGPVPLERRLLLAPVVGCLVAVPPGRVPWVAPPYVHDGARLRLVMKPMPVAVKGTAKPLPLTVLAAAVGLRTAQARTREPTSSARRQRTRLLPTQPRRPISPRRGNDSNTLFDLVVVTEEMVGGVVAWGVAVVATVVGVIRTAPSWAATT